MNVLELLESKGLQYKLTYDNSEAILTCPNCGASNSKFYVNVETGAFICFRASCGIKGGPKKLIELLGGNSEETKLQVSERARNVQEPEPIPEEAVEDYYKNLLSHLPQLQDYFIKKRGYAKETLNRFRLGWDSQGHWVIPIRNEKGECVNFKFKSIPINPNVKSETYSIPGRGGMRLFNSQIFSTEVKPEELIICEGEPDCMRLCQEEYNAVTSTGGTGNFKPEWVPLFKGVKKIYICQDNDKNLAGQRGAIKIAELFLKNKITTYIVNLPNPREGIEEKIDVTDFFTTLGRTREHFDLLLQSAQPYTSPEEENSHISIVDELVELAIVAGVQIILDQRKELYTILPEEPFVAYPIHGDGKFRGWLAGRYYERMGVGFSGHTYNEVIDSLEAKAYHENKLVNLWDRVGVVNTVNYYDIGDGKHVIKTDENGSKLISKPEIIFRRYKHQASQIIPAEKGNFKELLKFINLKNEGDEILLLTYIVAGLNPTIPRPLLALYGSQGSAKSTALRIIRCLLDPSFTGHHPSQTGNLLSPPTDDSDLAGKSVQNYCLFFDNISYCPIWLSDSLCRLITGCTFTKRKLYTDDEQVVFDTMPLVAVSGINLITERPDLLDRSLLIEMERISDDKRLEEKIFWSEFHTALPSILGGLFFTLSKALANYEKVKLDTLPRMADYARFAVAAAIAMGYTPEQFLKAYARNVRAQNSSAIDSSPTAQVLIDFVNNNMVSHVSFDSEKQRWVGVTSELYGLLKTKAEAMNLLIGGSSGFPKAVSWLWKRMSEVKPNLEEMGIYIAKDRTDLDRKIVISRRPISASDEPHVTQLTILTENSRHRDTDTDNGVLDEFKSPEGGQKL